MARCPGNRFIRNLCSRAEVEEATVDAGTLPPTQQTFQMKTLATRRCERSVDKSIKRFAKERRKKIVIALKGLNYKEILQNDL